MAEYTKHLRLIKPGGNDYYNIDDFNQNSELIDKETEKLSNAVTKIQEGATKDKKGIVQFGTEEGKALEGMMLARLAGCVGYGGDIQTAGVKDVNYIYYDRNTRKMYKCLNQNSDVSANVANFIPLDNNSLLDRLENLISFKEETNNPYPYPSKIIKIGNVVIETISCTSTIGIRKVPVYSKFKKVCNILITPYISKGQTEANLMQQVVHSTHADIVNNKLVEIYSAGNQSIEISIVGII